MQDQDGQNNNIEFCCLLAILCFQLYPKDPLLKCVCVDCCTKFCCLLATVCFQLYPKDPLPKCVCVDCCTKLDQCSDFLEAASQAQVTLHMIYSDTKKEEEVDTHEHKPELNHEPDHDSNSSQEEVSQVFIYYLFLYTICSFIGSNYELVCCFKLARNMVGGGIMEFVNDTNRPSKITTC